MDAAINVREQPQVHDNESLSDASTIHVEEGIEQEKSNQVDVAQVPPVTFPDGGVDAWLCCIAASVNLFCGFGERWP